MNHIPGFQARRHRPLISISGRCLYWALIVTTSFLLTACGAPAAEPAEAVEPAGPTGSAEPAESDNAGQDTDLSYSIEYLVVPDPAAGGATVEMTVKQSSPLLSEFNMRAPAAMISDVSGDGDISHDNDRLIWKLPRAGGRLRWFVLIDHQRNGGAFDAHIDTTWAIFRAEDVIPQAATRTRRGATSVTTLKFDLPLGWSSVTEYFGRDDSYLIDNPNRRFDRPAGWILLGDIGVRFETVAGVRVKIAAPVGHGLRRMDILALLRWTLPDIVRLFPEFPQRLTVIGADDPMWRGGLSGPRSLFIHASRPLLSENATSTLLHELIHLAMGARAEPGADWIVEGLAEYYSLEILARSDTISDQRRDATLKKLAQWGQDAAHVCVASSSGAVTARAVTLLAAIDAEIRKRSNNKNSLDDVTRALVTTQDSITIQSFLTIAAEYTGSDSTSLRAENFPGCNISPDSFDHHP
jgi:hypothetical protein